ncbi:cytotoxic T-lymphocyte protein 4 [Nelusetta ayraudi]|uniref:cytotoxic T-lymphocyte protein 4 n=1 Tax=Nelusetta ayraudi TaxID=303726 RepID=UPI003F6F878B
MPLADCMTRWIILTLVLLPVCNAVTPSHSYKVLSMDGTATVPCHITASSPFPEEIRVTVLKGFHSPQKICSSILNLTEKKEKSVINPEGGNCTAQVNVDVLEVTMSGLAAADTDVYRCVAEILFPPPYLRFRANATLVHVIEKSECFVEPPHVQMAQSDDQEKENTPAISAPVGILAVLVLLVLFTIIILQVRKGRRETVHVLSAMAQKRISAVSCDVA